MVTSIGKQSGEFAESVLKKKRKGCGGKDLRKMKVLSLEWKSERVMNDLIRHVELNLNREWHTQFTFGISKRQ